MFISAGILFVILKRFSTNNYNNIFLSLNIYDTNSLWNNSLRCEIKSTPSVMYTRANSLHYSIKYAHDNTYSLRNYSFPLHLYQNSSLWYGKSKQSKTNAMT